MTPTNAVQASVARSLLLGAVLLAAVVAAGCGADARRGKAAASGSESGDSAAADTLGPPQFSWFAFNMDVGTAVLDSAGTFCLSSPNPTLGLREQVWIVLPTANPQRVAQARVTGISTDCVMSDAGKGERGYLLGEFTGGADPGEVMIALTHPVGVPNLVGTRAMGDIDGDGRPETFHACTSGEGVHLSIWSPPADTTAPPPRDGSPPGDRRWHRYHNLGEDVENTCTPGETR